MVDPMNIFDLRSKAYFWCQRGSALDLCKFLSSVSGNKRITGKMIRIPRTSVTINIPLGSPKNSKAKTPTTGAIIGAIPIMATTLDNGLPESLSVVVSLIMALDITVPTLAPMPCINRARINVVKVSAFRQINEAIRNRIMP